MAWTYLSIAGVMEWKWAPGLTFAITDESVRVDPRVIAVVGCVGLILVGIVGLTLIS
jgi:hypothetical protein